MYKEDLALNNLQWLICHKPNQTKSNQSVCILYETFNNILEGKKRKRVIVKEKKKWEVSMP